jgi:hypothetical protein
MRKIVGTSLLVLVAIAMLTMSALAQGEDVNVVPYRWDPGYTVYSDQNIILTAGWSACRRGAVQNFLTATNLSWSLNGEGLNLSGEDTNEYWSHLFTVPPVDTSSACMGAPLEEIWSTAWNYPIGQLPPGEYTVNFSWWLDHPVTDVADYDGDGHPDLIEGPIIELVTTTIHVEER